MNHTVTLTSEEVGMIRVALADKSADQVRRARVLNPRITTDGLDRLYPWIRRSDDLGDRLQDLIRGDRVEDDHRRGEDHREQERHSHD